MRDEIPLLGIIMSLDKWITFCALFLIVQFKAFFLHNVPERTAFVYHNFLMNKKGSFWRYFWTNVFVIASFQTFLFHLQFRYKTQTSFASTQVFSRLSAFQTHKKYIKKKPCWKLASCFAEQWEKTNYPA